MAKDVGSKKVIMASCAPPIHYPYVYGIDMPSRAELVAHGHTIDEVADAISADLVILQTLPDLVASVRQLNPSIERFKCSVFNGEYGMGGMDVAYLNHLEGIWSDNMKDKVVNRLTSTQAAAVTAAIAAVMPVTSGTSSTAGGLGSTGTPSTNWPADGVDIR